MDIATEQHSNKVDEYMFGQCDQGLDKTNFLMRSSGPLSSEQKTELSGLGVEVSSSVGEIASCSAPANRQTLSDIAKLPYVVSMEASR